MRWLLRLVRVLSSEFFSNSGSTSDAPDDLLYELNKFSVGQTNSIELSFSSPTV